MTIGYSVTIQREPEDINVYVNITINVMYLYRRICNYMRIYQDFLNGKEYNMCLMVIRGK